jgi:hypothetical protein
MATSLPNVNITSNTWVDLYTETGITTGTQLIIQNIGTSDCRLVEASSQPQLQDGYNLIPEKEYLSSAITPVGAWAYADPGTILHVEEA